VISVTAWGKGGFGIGILSSYTTTAANYVYTCVMTDLFYCYETLYVGHCVGRVPSKSVQKQKKTHTQYKHMEVSFTIHACTMHSLRI